MNQQIEYLLTHPPSYVEINAHETESVHGRRGGEEVGQQTVAHMRATREVRSLSDSKMQIK